MSYVQCFGVCVAVGKGEVKHCPACLASFACADIAHSSEFKAFQLGVENYFVGLFGRRYQSEMAVRGKMRLCVIQK